MMESLDEVWEENPGRLLTTAAIGLGIAATALVLRARRTVTPKVGELLPGETRDKVYFYAFDRWAFGANPSGPCCKLETYLRLAKVDYEYVKTRASHPRTGKLPYIRHNGRSIPDSNFIIQYLIEDLGAQDFDAHLTPEQRGQMLAVRTMVEESLYFTLTYDRWIAQTDNFVEALASGETSPPRAVLGFVFNYILKPKVKKALHGQGTGRLTKEEIMQRAEKQIAALAAVLGPKEYFSGDKVCLADISIFGYLSGCLYNPWSSHRPMIEAHPNLVAWCERVKALAYPDWDKL